MDKPKVSVYGLSTEGYMLACKMSLNGADVSIIDESSPAAVTITPEIASTYPNVDSLKDDEPLLTIEPHNTAISKSQYLVFAPKIRRKGQDIRNEITAKFKDAVQFITKNTSIVYAIPVGFGGNGEAISYMEHVTGFEAGESVNYFYHPVSRTPTDMIGSLTGGPDARLSKLLADDNGDKRFVSLQAAEHLHGINVLSRLSRTCCILEVCKFGEDDIIDNIISGEYGTVFLDEMMSGMYDIRTLSDSFTNSNTMTYMINGILKSTDAYIKRLIDGTRSAVRNRDLKTSRTKITLSWSLDQHEMRGDKIELLETLATKLRDYMAEVETVRDDNFTLPNRDQLTFVIACSQKDCDRICKYDDERIVLIKANPLCETTPLDPQ